MKANDNNDNKLYKAAEVKLMYMSEVRSSDRIQIKNADDAACLFFMVWDMGAIEHLEE